MIAVSDEILTQTLQEVVDNFLIPKFISLGMNTSGSWIKALRVEVVNGTGYIKGKDYTIYLNFGRGPNKDQSEEGLKKWAYWYGVNVLKPWASSKGLVFNNIIAVAYSIAKKGTKVRMERQDFLNILESPEVRQYIYTKIKQNVSGQIRLEIVRRLKQTFQ